MHAVLPGTRRCCRMAWRRHMLRRCCGLLRCPARTLTACIDHAHACRSLRSGAPLPGQAHYECWQHSLQVLGPTPEYYGLWPVDHLSTPWNLLAEALYQQVIYDNLPVGCRVVAVDLFY